MLFAFHRARSGNDADRAVADRQAARPDDGRFRSHFEAGDFIRGQNRHDFGHAWAAFERIFVRFAIVADHGDHGAFGPLNYMRPQTETVDPFDHVLDIGRLGVFFHDNDHGRVLNFGYESVRLTAV